MHAPRRPRTTTCLTALVGTALAGLALTAPAAVAAPTAPASVTPSAATTAVPGLAPLRRQVRAAAVETVLGSGLDRGQVLRGGQALRSPSGRWSVVLTAGGDLLYQEAANRLSGPVSLALTDPQEDYPGSFLALQGDGNLVLYSASGTVRLVLEGTGRGQRLQVQDDGNVVLYGAGASVALDFHFADRAGIVPGQVLLPGDQLRYGDTRLVMQGDGNLVLYVGSRAAFSTRTNGNPGAAAVLQGDGNLVVYSAGPAVRPLFSAGSTTPASPYLALQVEPGQAVVVRESSAGAESRWSTAWSSDTVLPGSVLLPGDRRTSLGGRCTLVLQGDGNLVDYCAGRAVYSTGTRASEPLAQMTTGGDFVVYPAGVSTGPVFRTRTSVPGSRLVVQDDDNVVVYTPAGKAVFSTR